MPLLDLPNPLKELLGKEFFDTIPTSPGVYRFFCTAGSVLYVGKAKNLRSRLMSYQRAKPEKASRKTIALIRTAERIEWEICSDEASALIRENELLREMKPPFNSANTKPEIYSFFGIRLCGEIESAPAALETSIKLSMKSDEPEHEMFGAFKSRSKCHHAFFALRRLFWTVQRVQHIHSCRNAGEEVPFQREEFSYPWEILTKSRVNEFSTPLQREQLNWVSDFFRGSQFLTHTHPMPRLIVFLKEKTDELKNLYENVPLFYQNWFSEDLNLLLVFYKSGPLKNTELKSLQKADLPIITQNAMDDLLVMRSFRTK